ncbi:PREDICTED: CENP-B homolog protein 2-like [Ceratosolen solmsi marchali]|uniref:CENP-B homolog protein 2-like n=1 Tax=Ceratosolen solmsi marchali TaxID=326594 RepID=A0AAJ6YEK8_9HYME|nr:PREDICTED: CENP-B homolog protein 2-like [Ceratosolen solmsi marchali]
MVRKYKRKTNRQQWGKNKMIEAVNAVLEGMQMKIAAQKFNIPKTTLMRWYEKAKCNDIETYDVKLGRFKTVFTAEQEYQLKQYIKYLQCSLCEPNSLELRQIAFQFAEMNNISHKFNRATRIAGQEWYTNFLKRNSDIEPMSSNSTYFSELNDARNIEKFFNILTNLQHYYNFSSNRIFNVNETCYITMPSLKSRIDNILKSELITIITCCNAAGTFIPPLMIFPTNIEDLEFFKKCPQGAKIVYHPAGSMQKEIFYPIWVYHLLDYVKPSRTDPILLLLNGHTMHVKNLEFIAKAQEFNIHMLSIPVNTIQKLHPLEFHFMENLKTYYSEEKRKWMQKNNSRFINLTNVSEIFGAAYTRAAVPSNAINGFQASGIYPLNQYTYANTVNTPQTTPLFMEILQDNESQPIINNNIVDTSISQNTNYRLFLTNPSDNNNIVTDNNEIIFNQWKKLKIH